MTLTRGAPDDALTAPADRRPAASPAAGPAGSVGSVGASTVDRVVRVLLALAVVWYLGTGLWQAAHDAPTVDEAVDVSSGVATLVHHDLRMNPEHAPLPKVLSVLPALLARPVVPEGASWQDGDWFGFTDDFVRANRDAGRLDTVLFLARLVPLAEGLGCAWLIHLLARRFFGRRAADVTAFLWCTTPVVVGLAHFAGIDVAFTLATLVVAHAMVRFLDAPGARAALLLGAACAALLLTRHSGLGLWLFAAVVVAAVLWRVDRRTALRCAALVVVVAFVGVWLGVRLLAPGGSGDAFGARADSLVAEAGDRSIAARAALALPFPAEYRAGLAYLVVTSDERPAYLFGQAWDGGRWWFFPGSVVAKVPLGALAAMVAGGVLAFRRRDIARRRLAVGVLGPAAVSFAFVLAQPLNLGVRYVLPSLALAMVLAGAVVAPLLDAFGSDGASRATRDRTQKGSVGRVVAAGVVAIGVAAQGAAVLGAGTHSLAWTAPPFTPAYRFVSDSNLDYGQDNDRVAAWAAQHPGAWVALLRPRGVDNPSGTRELRGAAPAEVTGWIAVSATRLTVLDRDELSWLRAYCPVGDIGGSVLLYRIDATVDPTPGPVMPAAPCSSGDSVSTRP